MCQRYWKREGGLGGYVSGEFVKESDEECKEENTRDQTIRSLSESDD